MPLPNLETLSLADNALTRLPDGLLRRLTRLRILNLAGNQFVGHRRAQFRRRFVATAFARTRGASHRAERV